MNILFFMDSVPNYVPDLLLHGLRKLLGPDVVDYPRKECLYNGVLGLGICPEEMLCPDWFPQDYDTVDRDDIPEKISASYFDYIVCDVRAIPLLKDTIKKVTVKSQFKLAIIDGEDSPFLIRLGDYVICRRETDGTDFSIPLPMSLPEEIFNWIRSFDDNEKAYTVGFIGAKGKMSEKRKGIIERLKSLYPDSLLKVTDVPACANATSGERIERNEYYSGLQRCRIVLNLRGSGNDTFRFWENAACNALQISESMPLFIPNDFKDKQHLMRFSHIDELRRMIDNCLANQQETDQMIHDCRQHLMDYHLTTKRAAYFLDRIKRTFF